MRSLAALLILVASPVLAAGYLSPADLRADTSVVSPDPFRFAAPGRTPPPAPVAATLSGMPQLTLCKPYVITVDAASPGVLPLPVRPASPYTHGPAAVSPSVAKDRAADWRQPWQASWTGSAWDALQDAWSADPVALRRAFRAETHIDWPLAEGGPRAEAARLAAARWVRARWAASVQTSLAAARSACGIRGPVQARSPLDADLTVLFTGANNPAPLLAPRVTGDPRVNRYGMGFLVRLCADVSERIPAPVLDLSGLTAADGSWVRVWIDEAVRQGVAGMEVVPPSDAAARRAVMEAVRPLGEANVFLPPPGDVGILVSLSTCTLEPGAWVEAFQVYAAMREVGIWPGFITDDQVAAGAHLEGFRAVVVPAARWADTAVLDSLAGYQRRGGTVCILDSAAFRLSLRGAERTDVHRFWGSAYSGGVINWKEKMRRWSLPDRGWLAGVTARSVVRVTGHAAIPTPIR